MRNISVKYLFDFGSAGQAGHIVGPDLGPNCLQQVTKFTRSRQIFD